MGQGLEPQTSKNDQYILIHKTQIPTAFTRLIPGINLLLDVVPWAWEGQGMRKRVKEPWGLDVACRCLAVASSKLVVLKNKE